MLAKRTFRIVLVDPANHIGLGIRQSARFSKEVAYDGNVVTVEIDNENLVAEDVPAVKGIRATPATVKLFMGHSTTLAVRATYDDGSSQFVTLDAVCESSDSEVAEVRDGIVYAKKKEGKTDISITYTDAFGTDHTATVAVEASVPANIYTWKAADWYRNRVSDRLGAADIKCHTKENTITITKTGAQNIALRYRE